VRLLVDALVTEWLRTDNVKLYSTHRYTSVTRQRGTAYTLTLKGPN